MPEKDLLVRAAADMEDDGVDLERRMAVSARAVAGMVAAGLGWERGVAETVWVVEGMVRAAPGWGVLWVKVRAV